MNLRVRDLPSRVRHESHLNRAFRREHDSLRLEEVEAQWPVINLLPEQLMHPNRLFNHVERVLSHLNLIIEALQAELDLLLLLPKHHQGVGQVKTHLLVDREHLMKNFLLISFGDSMVSPRNVCDLQALEQVDGLLRALLSDLILKAPKAQRHDYFHKELMQCSIAL